jgi:hypothetical protein
VSKFGNLKQIRDQINNENAQPDISSTRNAETPNRRNTEMPATPEPAPKRLGRPPAKRSDPDYTQVSGYVRRSTLIATKRKLLDKGDREFSELLEELLERWLSE